LAWLSARLGSQVDDAKKPVGVISLTDLINAVIDRMEAVKVISD